MLTFQLMMILKSFVEILYRNTLENYYPDVSNHPEPILAIIARLATSHPLLHADGASGNPNQQRLDTSFRVFFWSWQISLLFWKQPKNFIKFLGFIYKNIIKSGWHNGIHPKNYAKFRSVASISVHSLWGAHTFAKLESPYKTYPWAGFGESTFSSLEYTYSMLLLQSILVEVQPLYCHGHCRNRDVSKFEPPLYSCNAYVGFRLPKYRHLSQKRLGIAVPAKDHALSQFQQISLDSATAWWAWLQGHGIKPSMVKFPITKN